MNIEAMEQRLERLIEERKTKVGTFEYYQLTMEIDSINSRLWREAERQSKGERVIW